MKLEVDQIKEIMQAMREFELDELEITRGDDKMKLRRHQPPSPPQVVTAPMVAPAMPTAAMTSALPAGTTVPASAPAASAPQPAGADGATAEDEPGTTWVTSPFVGTFFRSPSPEAPPFVRIGDDIIQGKTLCIVEAMKLMNEIEAEVGGVVVEIAVENGNTVEYGDRLFKIKTS